MLFHFRYQVQGGHTHVRVFAGPHENALGKCGDLTFRNEEFNIFKTETETETETDLLATSIDRRNCIQFLPEGENPLKNGTGIA